MRQSSLLPLLAALAVSACAMQPAADDARATASMAAASSVPPAAMQEEDILPGDVPTSAPSASGALAAIPERVLPGGILEIGKADAPVSLLVFTNHSCEYCRRFHREQFPRLLAEYVAEGELRISLVPFPLQKYPQSERNAGIALCAAKQGKGRAAHDLLFADGMDAGPYEACLQDPQTAADLRSQRSWAKVLGIDLIPTFVLDGRRITGLPEYAELRGEIATALREADSR